MTSADSFSALLSSAPETSSPSAPGLPEEKVLESYHNGEHWVVKVHVEGLMREKTAKPIELSYAFIRNQAERENRI